MYMLEYIYCGVPRTRSNSFHEYNAEELVAPFSCITARDAHKWYGLE